MYFLSFFGFDILDEYQNIQLNSMKTQIHYCDQITTPPYYYPKEGCDIQALLSCFKNKVKLRIFLNALLPHLCHNKIMKEPSPQFENSSHSSGQLESGGVKKGTLGSRRWLGVGTVVLFFLQGIVH